MRNICQVLILLHIPYLKSVNRQLPFPPRWGEHNEEVYGVLGYDAQKLAELREKGVV